MALARGDAFIDARDRVIPHPETRRPGCRGSMGIHDTNDSTISERMIRLVADRVDYRYSLWVIIPRVAVRATFTLFRDGSTPHAEMDGLSEPGTISTQ